MELISSIHHSRNKRTPRAVGETQSAYDTGRILGRGSFCVVKEYLPKKNMKSKKSKSSDEESTSTSFLLALKQPRSDLSSKEKIHANECLQNEVAYLSALDHPNIIKLVNTTQEEEKIDEDKIIMERLHGTLREKITWWDDPCTSMTTFRYRQRQRHSFSTKNPLWNTRIQILSDIANAMEYLHSKNIILRDLKSENAGFDINGKIKLFDFGLATALRNENKVGPDRYNFSVDGGTLRYMSPEAANGDPYGKATDVYSFALLAWETLSLSIPFASMSTEEFIHRVIEKRSRPKLNPKWPKYLKALFTKSWATNASYRPSFQQIQRQLDIDPVAQKNVQSNSCLSWLGRCRS